MTREARGNPVPESSHNGNCPVTPCRRSRLGAASTEPEDRSSGEGSDGHVGAMRNVPEKACKPGSGPVAFSQPARGVPENLSQRDCRTSHAWDRTCRDRIDHRATPGCARAPRGLDPGLWSADLIAMHVARHATTVLGRAGSGAVDAEGMLPTSSPAVWASPPSKGSSSGIPICSTSPVRAWPRERRAGGSRATPSRPEGRRAGPRSCRSRGLDRHCRCPGASAALSIAFSIAGPVLGATAG
jgi:hypothetical protein